MCRTEVVGNMRFVVMLYRELYVGVLSACCYEESEMIQNMIKEKGENTIMRNKGIIEIVSR